MTEIVRTEGLVKRYDNTLAVAGIDLSVDQGEIFGLVGPNGAGKTTTLRILATLLLPSAGTAEIAGMSVTRNPDQVRRVLGFMPDSFGVYDDMKVWEYLDFFARCYGIGPADRRRMISDLLELVDLGRKRDDYVQTLSRGMQQRLCLAHALVHDPLVLLLDEPASGLDPRARVELRELLRELRSLGKTILISSHILPELEELCTSVAIVDRGQVLAQGRVADIERRLRFGAVLRIRLLLEGEELEAARARFGQDPDVASAVLHDDGTIEIGFRGDDAATARLLAESVAAGHADRELRPGRERPRGALPAGHLARPRTARSGRSERMTELTDTVELTPAAVLPRRSRFTLARPDRGRHRRDRRQGAARPDARAPRLRDHHDLPGAARRIRAHGRAALRGERRQPVSAARPPSPARRSGRASSPRSSC